MNQIFSLFNFFALLFAFRGAQVLQRVYREWPALKKEPLTPPKKSLINQAVIFITVPLSIIVHEFFHALATWLVGGQIVDYDFKLIYGWVLPSGNFTAQEVWFIAVAGTIGTVVFGTAVYLLLRHHPLSSFRFFGLRTLRFQLHWAFIYYPLFSIFTFGRGDWGMIYDFPATPVLSSLTAACHVVVLYLIYWADRQGVYEMPGFETAEAGAHFAKLEREAVRNPQDKQLTIRYIQILNQSGANHKAKTHLKAYLKQNPDDADGYALLAGLEAGKKNHIPRKSKRNAEKALNLGLTDIRNKAMAYRILGEYALERNQYQEATNQFSQAIAIISGALHKENPQPHLQSYLAELFYRRHMAYRRQQNYDLAGQDIQNALQLAQKIGDNGRALQYNQELANIQQHAGRQLGNSTNAHSKNDVV